MLLVLKIMFLKGRLFLNLLYWIWTMSKSSRNQIEQDMSPLDLLWMEPKKIVL
jgi:hypothetical protein